MTVRLRPSWSSVGRRGTVLAMGLLAIEFAAPLPVFADNGASLGDLWNSILAAAIAAAAIPFLVALAFARDMRGYDFQDPQRPLYPHSPGIDELSPPQDQFDDQPQDAMPRRVVGGGHDPGEYRQGD